jgi:LPS export ABC transporter protein LptC
VRIILTRKKSLALGLGLLGAFFVTSGVIIYFHNSARIPPSSSSLSREVIEGVVSTPHAQQTPSSIGFVLNEFHRSSVKGGKVVWEIFGKKGRYDAGNNRAEVDEPVLNVNRDNGDTIKLTAQRAELSLTGTDLLAAELFNDVVVIYKGETTIKTDRAIYVKETETVEMPNLVIVENPIFSIQGKKLIAKIQDQELKISQGVKSTFKPVKRKS